MKARPAGPGGASLRKTALIAMSTRGETFNANLGQCAIFEIRLDHVQGHMPPAQALP